MSLSRTLAAHHLRGAGASNEWPLSTFLTFTFLLIWRGGFNVDSLRGALGVTGGAAPVTAPIVKKNALGRRQ